MRTRLVREPSNRNGADQLVTALRAYRSARTATLSATMMFDSFGRNR
jgi:hypothetical protein